LVVIDINSYVVDDFAEQSSDVQVSDTTDDAMKNISSLHKDLLTNLLRVNYINCYKDANRCALRFSI